jgi:hypothetical protein
VHCWTYESDEARVLAVIGTLSAALEDDPSTHYFCHRGQHQRFYDNIVRASLQLYPSSTYMYSTGDGACVALTHQYPRTHEPTLWQQLRVSLAPLAAIRWDRWAVGSAAADYFDSRKQSYFKVSSCSRPLYPPTCHGWHT